MWRLFMLNFIILGMLAALLSLTLFSTNNTITQINDKLSEIHNQSQQQINQQGNISLEQRDKIIKEFESLPESGFASHQDSMNNMHLLKDILGNLTATR